MRLRHLAALLLVPALAIAQTPDAAEIRAKILRGAEGFERGMHYPEPEQPPDGSPDSLLAGAIARAGGAAALARARVLAWEGDAVVHAGGRELRIAGRWRVQPPDSAVVTTWDVARGESSARALVVAAPRGWGVIGGRFAALPDGVLANEREEFYLYDVMRLVPLRDPGVTLAPAPADSLGQRGFVARRAGRPDVTLYVDSTGRLAHVRMTVHEAATNRPTTQDAWLAGTIEGEGVRWPRELRLSNDGVPYFALTLRAFGLLPRLDDPLLAGPR